MKKRTLLLGAAALLSTASFAQADTSIGLRLPTQKGSWMLGSNIVLAELAFGGGSAGAATYYNVAVSPRAGYFVLDNLALGLGFNGQFAGQGRYYNSQSYGVVAFARYYFGNAVAKDGHVRKTRYFVEGGGSYNAGRSAIRNNNDAWERGTFSSSSYYGMAGLNHFLTKNVALEAGLQFTHNDYPERSLGNQNNLGFNLGLKIFMGKR
jgi:hypothetical protein